VATIELGTHHLRDVPDAVVVHQVGDGEFPELRVDGSRNTNLPVAPARLLGRERELAAVRDALGSSRLVTLTAAGGTGKTRLALAVGEALLNHQPGGVWFVDLSTVLRDEELPTAIARVLGLQVSGTGQQRQVVDYLCGIDALVILDNCEHLVDACAELLETFLRTPGSSRVLATTREYFDIDGEQTIRLTPLDTHDVNGSAVELFVERALGAESSILFDAADRATIAELCRHLDGSPLAIELAAGRSGVMTPTELLAAIGERFQLLKGGRRRRSKRTLEDTLQWSYDLLDEAEQRVFRFLGVFSGTFERSAVASITGLSATVTLDLLESLTAKNLVVSERTGAVHRFALLETPAAYAEQLLEEHDETVGVRDRHLDHFLEATKRFVAGPVPTPVAAVLAPDRTNLLAAIEWAQARDRWQDAARLMAGSYEAVSAQADVVFGLACKTAEHLDDMPEPDRWRATGTVFASALQLDDFTTAAELAFADQASDAPFRRVRAAGCIAYFTMSADPSLALARISDAREQLHEIVDPIARLQLAGGLEVLAAWAHAMMGDFDACLERCQAARELHDQLELPTANVSMGTYVEAMANAELGNRDRVLELAGELDATESIWAKAANARIMAYLLSGDTEAAMPHLKTQALDAVTGRLSRAANDSMLFLALLAEHD
ncbi:hypothetical protein JYT71_01610, partial [Acidimicrobiaceae bacterium AH-315-P05]|nr:hypothetical protein [Acidimicrobiaceae bacterium AH-315-P05]